MTKPINILIAGVGGQGVNTLTKAIIRLCERHEYLNQGSTYKGGAQRLGSIHSVLRIFPASEANHELFSPQIRPGELHLMLGLEPWETLRYHSYFNTQTAIYMNTEISPLFVERYRPTGIADPVKTVQELGLKVMARNFNAQAKQEFGTTKMANFLLLKAALTNGHLPFSPEELEPVFQEITGREIKAKESPLLEAG